ncbi:MAG: pyruvate kinase [Proteobacteria bacterium]|jgi:pyruvate kinase|nr:pyruvate kinase [Pseudomonadota bacterium]
MSIITRVDLLKNRRTKIVATVGPASDSDDALDRMLRAGVDLFRLNMSHGDQDYHGDVFQRILNNAERLDRPVGILADLCGPKIRTGAFEGGGIDLIEGETVTVTTRPGLGRPGLIVSQYANLCRDVEPGDRILLADGLLELAVITCTAEEARCRIVAGGRLTSHKGINLPGVDVSAPSLTDKDISDAQFVMSLGVDYIALSFVRRARDVKALRDLVSSVDVRIIAKIEKPEALANADEILAAADGIMVARGDLGVELPPEEVPVAQTQLITMARKMGKPVIVATQMLESMISNARPTRAEVTDVSHAVNSGADAVMLSGETAAGSHPVESVLMMDRIAKQTEAHIWSSGGYGIHDDQLPPVGLSPVIASAAAQMSRELRARAIIVLTQSGVSAHVVSTARPAAPIIAVTGSEQVYNRMTLLWGVIPILDAEAGKANPNELARRIAEDLGLGVPGQYVLLVRGFHDEASMNLPSITVVTI